MHYKTADTDIQHCIQHITNMPHSVLTGDVNAHPTLWHSYTDEHTGQLIADDISNSDHITQSHQPEFQTPHYNKHLHQTTYPSSPQSTYDMTTDYNKPDGHSPTTSKLTGHNSRKIQSAFAQTTIPTNIHTANRMFTNIILMADNHTIPKGKMHSNCRLLPEDIVCKITQRNNIRRTNTCDPALTLLNEEITSDIQKLKQNIWKEHVDAQWDHRHNTHILWNTIQRAPPTTKLALSSRQTLCVCCYGHKINLPRFNDLLISEARNQHQRQEYV